MIKMDNELRIDNVLSINVGDHRIREKGQLLLVGSCVPIRFSKIVRDFIERDGGYFPLHVCLEQDHVNQVGFKIGSIVSYSKVKRIVILTIDGSPHCVQLHFVLEDIKKHFIQNIKVEHYVIEKGRLFKISAASVKRARHLSKIQSMIDRQ